MTINEMIQHTGLSKAAFARKYKIKLRTLEDWSYGKKMPRSECMFYLLERCVTFDYGAPTGTKIKEENNMKYYIDYGTGAESEQTDGTIEAAMETATDGLRFTQKDVIIYDEDKSEVARLPWWEIVPGEDDCVTARYGDFGFYGEWTINK